MREREREREILRAHFTVIFVSRKVVNRVTFHSFINSIKRHSLHERERERERGERERGEGERER